MGADWYTCLTYFGYRIALPDDMSYRAFVNTVNEINEFLQEPYKITGLLQSFHSRMESMSEWEQESFDESAVILIGFEPKDNSFDMFTHHVNELKEYVTDNHYLMGLELDESPKFYSGIEWFTNMYYEYESSDEEEDEEDYDEDADDEEEDDEEEDDENEEDEASSDEDETKIAPE
jgi:hypothetical protein